MELESARQDLQETEMDKVLEDTSALLDNLFLEAETLLNSRLDNVDALLEQVIETINIAASADGNIATALGSEGAIAIAVSDNAISIKDTLASETNKVGTTLSNAMNSIWNTGDGNAKSVLTTYGENFQKQQTTTNTVLNSIKANIDRMVDDVDKNAQKKVETTKTNPSSKVNTITNNSSNNGNKGNNGGNKQPSKPSVTDNIIKGISAAIWIYGKNSGWGNNPFRENKLSDRIGASNAKKVQDYINKHGLNGDLYNFWVQNGKNLDKYKYNAFKLGVEDINTAQLAWTQEGKKREFIVRPSDGAILTPVAKGDSILNATASGNIWNMANNPAEFIKENLKLDASSVPNTSNVNNSIVQNFENITFSMPNVHGYNELLSEMQRDPKFEKFILSMTIDQIAGRSKLAKGKSIR